MNQGVEILLARMDSNPDEFVSWDGYVVGKWDWIMRDVQKRALGNRVDLEDGVVRIPFLSDEEVKALWNKVESLRADQFTKKVMRTLLEEEDEHVVENPFADAVMRGMGQLSAYQTKPAKILTSAALKADMLKLLEETAPDLEEESRKQILVDLQALEASKARRKK